VADAEDIDHPSVLKPERLNRFARLSPSVGRHRDRSPEPILCLHGPFA